MPTLRAALLAATIAIGPALPIGAQSLADSAAAAFASGRAQERAGRWDAALDAYRRSADAYARVPSDPSLPIVRGPRFLESQSAEAAFALFAQLGVADSALRWMERAAANATSPRRSQELRRRQASLYATLFAYDLAIAQLGDVIEDALGARDANDAYEYGDMVVEEPWLVDDVESVGMWYATLSRPDSARRYFAAARQLRRLLDESDDATATLREARHAFALGWLDEARRHATAAEEDNGGERALLLARVHDAMGARDSARLMIRRLAERPALPEPRAFAVAEAARAIGEWDAAAATLGALTRSTNRRTAATALTRLGLVEEARGNRGVARMLLLRADSAWRATTRYSFARGEIHRALARLELQAGGAGAWPRAESHLRAADTAFFEVRARIGGDLSLQASGDAAGFAGFHDEWALAQWLHGPGTAAQRARIALALVDEGRARAARAQRGEPWTATPGVATLAERAAAWQRDAMRSRELILGFAITADTLLTVGISPQGRAFASASAVDRDTLASDAAAWWQGFAAGGGASLRGVEPAAARADAARRRLASGRLHAALLPATVRTALDSAHALLIVPHGALALVPFAALPGSQTDVPLGVTHAIRYAPSFSLGSAEAARPAAADAARAVVVGNPRFPDVLDQRGRPLALEALPSAEMEATRVAALLGVEPLIGDDATEASVRASLSQASIVHLATHGLAFSAFGRSDDSFVLLAPSPAGDRPTPDADGVLRLGDLARGPRLSAALVTLSACQSGLGNLREAEGVIGFPRGLLAQGASRVLVSLWNVDDAATAQLMETFYAGWLREGLDVAEALRRAQASLRADPRYADPRYWAAFQLVGAR